MSRRADIRDLMIRAASRPLNVLPAAAIAGIGLAFSWWLLVPVALGIYAVSAYLTVTDSAEARRLIERRRGAALPSEGARSPEESFAHPEIQRLYEEASREAALLREALGVCPVPLDDVATELVGLEHDLTRLCQKAQTIWNYLESVDEPLLRGRLVEARRRAAGDHQGDDLAQSLSRACEALEQQLERAGSLRDMRERIESDIHALSANLGAIRGDVVRVAVSSEDDAAERVRGQVGSVRQQLTALVSILQQRETEAAEAPLAS
ncbi:hypothetical protein [Miltoncostaea oceani]|uniref:hypothetical protein n=1 Tax=Miltoncostaea oceani TaxID=2843216 RepID=UPI001C3DB9D9|nr:hypothetical protein [Miltoncostaea oceani]